MWECSICGMDYGVSTFPMLINLVVGEEGKKVYNQLIKDFAKEQGISLNCANDLDNIDFTNIWKNFYYNINKTKSVWICSMPCLFDYTTYVNKYPDDLEARFYHNRLYKGA